MLSEKLLRDARAFGINVFHACEQGLVAALAARRRARWLEENGQAIAAWNEHVETHGLPLATCRQS